MSPRSRPTAPAGRQRTTLQRLRWLRLGAAVAAALIVLSTGCADETVPSSPTTGPGGQTPWTSAGGSGPEGYTPIAEVKETDFQGIPLLSGQTVTIRGVVTVPTGVFSIENHEIYVQDDTGGVSVYEVGQHSATFDLGQDVEVTGVVSHYMGKTEIAQPSFVLQGASAPLPLPLEITTGELCADGEPFEGNLVSFRQVTIVGGEPWPETNQEGNANILVDDGSGPCGLRLDHHTDLNGSPAPEGAFDAVGVVKQYDELPPYDTGYDLQPRFRTDVTPAAR